MRAVRTAENSPESRRLNPIKIAFDWIISSSRHVCKTDWSVIMSPAWQRGVLWVRAAN